MDILLKYFPQLTQKQKDRFERLAPLYREWNEKINVISRKDIDNLYVRHVLHSLAISRMVQFKPGAEILDLGTGGGFPGIPLAILFPETRFHLIDGTRKKIHVVNEVIDALDISNAKGEQVRAEELKRKGKYDFVVSRAVAGLDKLWLWSQPLIREKQIHALPNGLLALKGGNIREERKLIPKHEYVEIEKIQKFFPEPEFEEKFVIYVQA
jgi:16S rRNA (guanine527-N7)-methyltransferase